MAEIPENDFKNTRIFARIEIRAEGLGQSGKVMNWKREILKRKE